MPVNLDEIKKLPNEEKLKIIDEIWKSIEGDLEESEDNEESAETLRLLEEREAAYNHGELKFSSWEEVEQRLLKKAEQRIKRNQHE